MAMSRLNIKIYFYQYKDPHVEVRRSHDRRIVIMGMPVPGTFFVLKQYYK